MTDTAARPEPPAAHDRDFAGALPHIVHVGERPLITGIPHSTRRYSGGSALAFAPDGKHLAFISGLGPSFSALRVPVSGGEPEPFLEIDGANLSSLSWSASGTLVASAHRGGTERWQLYARRPDGSVTELAASEGNSVQHLLSQGACSPDGQRVAFSANARNPEDVDVLVADLDGQRRQTVVSGPAWHVAGYWSPDSRLLQVMRVEQNTDQYLFIVDPESGEVTEVTPHTGEEQNVPAGWLSDGRPLVITNHGREHLWLAAVDPATGEREAVDAPADWGVELAASAADGSVQAWTISEDGYSLLRWRGAADGIREVPGLDGVISDLTVSRDGTLAAYAYLPVTGPAELRLLHTGSGQTTILLRDDADDDERFRPETVAIPGPAGDISAYLYRAAGAGPRPAVLVIHGGPEWQSRPHLWPQLRRLLDAGITILEPNIHGSTGYGKSWQTAIHRDWGGVDLADFRAVAEWMTSQPEIDPTRIGVFGGSYGGFATLTCITRLPQYWRCAVDLFGPSNLVSSLEDAEPNWRRWNLLWIGDLTTDRDKLWQRSPLAHADDIRCPLLVMAGANDPRVRKRESDQIVDQLRARDQEVDYLVFGGEGHGVTSRENMAAVNTKIEEFLHRHLLAPE
jgi:dipeptidyl aminopeptidase/acylaminoacyl peptidase